MVNFSWYWQGRLGLRSSRAVEVRAATETKLQVLVMQFSWDGKKEGAERGGKRGKGNNFTSWA